MKTAAERSEPGGRRRTAGRWLGIFAVTCLWCALLGILACFGVVWAMYADLTASSRHHFTAGTGAEFVLGAIYDRFRAPAQIQADPELVYRPHVGENHARSPEYDVVITTTPEEVRKQPTDTATQQAPVLMVGDSFTLGLGVADGQTYSALLQQHYHWPTVNTGVISYGTARELYRLRRMGLLPKASMLVIQFCSNDARENHDYVQDPHAGFIKSEPGETWRIMQTSRYLEPTYFNVLKATVEYVSYRVRTEGLRHAIKDIVRSRRLTLGDPIHVRDRRTGADLADDFLAVLALFPEVKSTPILVVELNDRGASSGFIDALQRKIADRPNLATLALRLESEDFYRFDGHLTPRGHEKVAAQLNDAMLALRRRTSEAAAR